MVLVKFFFFYHRVVITSERTYRLAFRNWIFRSFKFIKFDIFVTESRSVRYQDSFWLVFLCFIFNFRALIVWIIIKTRKASRVNLRVSELTFVTSKGLKSGTFRAFARNFLFFLRLTSFSIVYAFNTLNSFFAQTTTEFFKTRRSHLNS
jgi:hypothetical protein